MAGKYPKDLNSLKMEPCVWKGQEPGTRHTRDRDKWERLLKPRARREGSREWVQINF